MARTTWSERSCSAKSRVKMKVNPAAAILRPLSPKSLRSRILSRSVTWQRTPSGTYARVASCSGATIKDKDTLGGEGCACSLVQGVGSFIIGGVSRNRTDDAAFAEPCLATWLPRRKCRDRWSQQDRTSLTAVKAKSSSVQSALMHGMFPAWPHRVAFHRERIYATLTQYRAAETHRVV